MVFNFFSKKFIYISNDDLERFKKLDDEKREFFIFNIIDKKNSETLFLIPQTLVEFKKLKNNISFLMLCYQYGYPIIDLLNPLKEIKYISQNVSSEFSDQLHSLLIKLSDEQQLFYKNNPHLKTKNFLASLFSPIETEVVSKQDYLDYINTGDIREKSQKIAEKLELPEQLMVEFIEKNNPLIIQRILQLNCTVSKNLVKKDIRSDLLQFSPKNKEIQNDLKDKIDSLVDNYFDKIQKK